MLLGLTLSSVCSAGGDCCCQGVQFTVYTYLISGLICFPFFEWGCLMGHKGRQLYICAADICFLIDSTPGKWSPQSPFLPQSPFFPTYTTCLLSPAAAVTLPTFPAVSGGLISDQKQLCFCLPACDWKDSAGSESPAVALEGNLSHLCTKHVTAQPRQCEKQWKKERAL